MACARFKSTALTGSPPSEPAGITRLSAKTVNLLGLVAFSAVGFALMLQVETFPGAYVLAAGAGLAALGIGIIGFYAVQRWGAASYLARRLAAWRFGRQIEGPLEHIHEVDDHFERFYARQPARFAAALALALAGWLIGVGEIVVIMWFLGAPVTLAEAWLIETVAQLVRAGAFFIPASLGATEAAMVLVYEALLGAPSLGFAVALIRRARELLWVAWGLWLGWLEAPGAAAAARASMVTRETAGASGAAQDGSDGS